MVKKRRVETVPLATIWEMLDEVWGHLEPILGEIYPEVPMERPRTDFWKALQQQGALRGRKKVSNPTDRGKPGTKKSLLVEAYGGPLGVTISCANVHDTKLLDETIESVVVEKIGTCQPY